MIHWLTINNHPSNPQQPIHSLRGEMDINSNDDGKTMRVLADVFK
jgi:hypothetical protein